jgi:hypothetical protein
VFRSRSLLAWCAAIAIGLGCSRHPKAEPPTPAAPAQPERPRGLPPPAQPNAAAAAPDPYAQASTTPSANPDTPAAARAAAAAEPTDSNQQKRDYSAELERMLAGGGACVQPRASTQSITVTTYLTAGGGVSRADIDGFGLEQAERACLRSRAEALHFAAPLDNAPAAVSATLQIAARTEAAAGKQETPKTDSLGMIVTQAPSGEGVTAGVVPQEDPGVVPQADPGVVPQADEGVLAKPDPADIPPPEPPAEPAP